MSSRMFRSIFSIICLTAAVSVADPPKSEPGTKKKETPPRISSKVDVHSVTSLTDKEASEVSFSAGRILKHVSQARNAIRDNKKGDASTHVEQGLKLLAIIDHVLPHSKVKAEIKSGELVYSDEDDVTPRCITLFDELERRDIISPIMQAKQEANRKLEKSKEAEPTVANGPVAVSHADLLYSTAKFDLDLARHALQQAKRSLDDGKLEMADNALLALESRGVIFEYAELDLPLAEVADNLKLAEAEIKAGRNEEAKGALHVAMDELKKYETQVGEKRGAEAKALHQEIDKVATELSNEKLTPADQEKHASKISEWWQRTTKWLKAKAK